MELSEIMLCASFLCFCFTIGLWAYQQHRRRVVLLECLRDLRFVQVGLELMITTWTDEKNERRCNLIDKEVYHSLTKKEIIELEGLQAEMVEYRDMVAPLPIEELRELHDSLVKDKADNSLKEK